MECSKLSHIISTTRLLPHFSPTNINVMKLCIFDQLGIDTESQFLAMALKALDKSLSPESLSIIRTKAIEIAKTQLMEHGPSITNTKTTLNVKPRSPQSSMTVHKYIEKQNDSALCSLHSDIIDYFGTFLTKQESIEFGYLNKHLFIETQKQSYLSKRCKDDMFRFHSNKCIKVLIGKNDAFNYTFPRSLMLELAYCYSNMVQKVPFFNNFFRRLSVLDCNSFSSLYCVPLNYLFIKNRNYYPNNESCDNIDLFRLRGCLKTDKRHKEARIKQVDTICKNFDRLISDHSSDDKIRGIKQFEFEFDRSMADMNLFEKRLLLRFGNISKSIHLLHTSLTLATVSELTSIFHPDLRHIYFDYKSQIMINIDMKNIENSVGMVAASLESIGFDTRKQETIPSCIDTLNQFDKFGIRRSIKQYTVHWSPPFLFGPELVILGIGDAVDIFDKIFFQDYDKHRLLESIIIKYQDNTFLLGTARLLLYFHQHYKKLFVERKLYLQHFHTIEVEMNNKWMREYHAELQQYSHNTSNPEFFQQERNKEYSIDDKKIEIKSSQLKQGIESFGIIYENIFYWLARRPDKSGRIIFRIE